MTTLLQVRELVSEFKGDHGVVRAVDGVSFELGRGEVLGVVGESGSGKSVTALSILGLLPRPHGRVVSGSVQFAGRELVGLPEAELRALRGARIAMIFQDPMSSLNPYLTVGQQLAEVAELHLGLTHAEAWQRAVELIGRVQIPDAARRVRQYPHELSGGMRQRAMIAMALCCKPDLLIADEPTTALDVTIQAQILALMRELQKAYGMAVILITHDMGVVAENADRVIVMYAGRKVEEADVADLFDRPAHPYTRGLLASIPHLDDAAKAATARTRLNEIKGLVPSLIDLPRGCSFADRCSLASDQCRAAIPPLTEHWPGHWVACWHAARVME